jgi:DNA primase
MSILELVQETGLDPKRKAGSHGGEYASPCPFCKDGDDRFLIWPQRHNKNGEYQGGRFSCRGPCGKYGDAITFLRLLQGLSYKEACERLKIQPKQRVNGYRTPRPAPKPPIADEPPDIWKEKAKAFTEWSHAQLLKNDEGLSLLKNRGFNDQSIARFCLGFNPKTLFRERSDWGLPQQSKENGKDRKLWLPTGIVIPTFSDGCISKVKVRRSDWKEGDKWPKYVEISGSKQTPSVYGDAILPFALVLESELDALLIQQEAADLVYCIALGGSTKQLDAQTDQLLRKTPLILFLPDFDEAGATAWVKWKKSFPDIQRILTPSEKAAGDYFVYGGNLREWLEESIKKESRM